jgi:hypothetical protein
MWFDCGEADVKQPPKKALFDKVVTMRLALRSR